MGGSGLLPNVFFFLRHGESANNQAELVNGWTNVPLTDRGRDQARAAATLLRTVEVSRIVTSSLDRARETAAIIASALGVEVDIVDALKERNWGHLENRPRALLTDYFMHPEGGETWEGFRDRCLAGLCGAAMPERTLLVGHAGTMRVLRDHLGIGDVKDRLPNATPLRFERDGDGGWSFVGLAS